MDKYDQKIVVNGYEISQHPPIPGTDQVNVIWIVNKDEEGMSLDLDKLFEEEF